MLEGLEAIDWASLSHAYGSAADLPVQLRALATGDETARSKARKSLASSIHHEGTVYSASAAVVPFLVSLASSPSVSERAWIVRFLSDLAVGDPSRWLDGFDVVAAEKEGHFDGEEAAPFRASYEAVERAVPALLVLLGDVDSAVRARAAMSLAWFSRKARPIRDALAARLGRENEPEVRASLSLSIVLHDSYVRERVELERVATFLDAADDRERVVAAFATLQHGESRHAARAFACLREAVLAEPPLLAWDAMPWNEGDLGGIALRGLQQGGPRRASELLATLFTLLERPTGPDDPACKLARASIAPLYPLATPETPPKTGWSPKNVPADLRRFAVAVAERPYLGSTGLYDALGRESLPNDLAPLRKFLGLATLPSALDRPLDLGGVTKPIRAWLAASNDDSVRARLVAASSARGDEAVRVAFEMSIAGEGAETQGEMSGMRFSITPSGVTATSLPTLILEAACARDPEGVLRGALPLAEKHAKEGPPREYVRAGTRLHTPAVMVLVAAATMACTTLHREPPEVFDELTKAALAQAANGPLLVRYFSLVSPARRARFFIGLATAAFETGWRGIGRARIDDNLDLVLELCDSASQAELLRLVAAFAFPTALAQLGRFGSASLLEMLIPKVIENIDDMSAWAEIELVEKTTERYAQELAALGLAGFGVLRRALSAPEAAPRTVIVRALEIVDESSAVATAMRDGGVTSRDERGLMALAEARAIGEAALIFRKGEASQLDEIVVLESDRLWAALLSLENAEEFLRHASRLTWAFHVRGRENLSLYERYGDEILPFIESRIESGRLRDVPWCVLPCLLEIGTEAGLRVALEVVEVDESLPKEATGDDDDDSDDDDSDATEKSDTDVRERVSGRK